MIDGSFSLMIEDLECTWELSTLVDKAKHIKPKKAPLNQFSLDIWVWGFDKPQKHVERVFNCDLIHPILVWDGYVLDGYHRILKSHLLGLDYIMVKEIVNIPSPDKTLDVPIHTIGKPTHNFYLSDFLDTMKMMRKCLNELTEQT
tara:strand:- start:117 stop:551 length:435 start_codon:yes stop_codon:yes gene_type:complete